MDAAEMQTMGASLNVEDGLDQYLSFKLGDEQYGVDILRVQEIKGWEGATPIPNMPQSILGVINLRGTIVPVVDLRMHFEMQTAPYSKTTVVIVVNVKDEDDVERTVGMVVDAVSEVHNIALADLKPPPEITGSKSSEAVKGLSILEDRMLIILDIDCLMNEELAASLQPNEIH